MISKNSKTILTLLPFAFLLVNFGFPPHAFAQVVKPQNIYRVAVNSGYVIEEGRRTTRYHTLTQLISDSLGRMHTEVDYNRLTQLPIGYRWHFFNGQQKVMSQHFTPDGLWRIEEFQYNPFNQLNRVIIKNVKPTDTTLILRVDYLYNPGGRLQKATGYNAKGKKGYTALSYYDSLGTEVERKVKGKKLSPPDSITYILRQPTYDSLGRMVKEVTRVIKTGKSQQSQTMTYRYNNDGLLVEKWIYSAEGTLVNRFEFINRADRRLNQTIVYDGDGNLIDHQAWRYELYETSNRRQRVLE